MKAFFAGIRRWWLRRFRGIVEPPAHARGYGTIWQEHRHAGKETTFEGWFECFTCECGQELEFTRQDYVIREQNHVDGCPGLIDACTHNFADLNKTPLMDLRPCQCPVTDARYIKHCPNCRRGHWKQAKP